MEDITDAVLGRRGVQKVKQLECRGWGSGQYVQVRSDEGRTWGSMCNRVVQRIGWQWREYAGCQGAMCQQVSQRQVGTPFKLNAPKRTFVNGP